MSKVKLCKYCKKHGTIRESKGYTNAWSDDIYVCPDCKHQLVDIDYPSKDFDIITQISYEPAYIESMINLRNTDPVKYQKKMAQIKNQIDQSKFENKILKPHCPTCNSTDIKKISTTAKATNTILFGILGTKRHKTFHCNNCGYEW